MKFKITKSNSKSWDIFINTDFTLTQKFTSTIENTRGVESIVSFRYHSSVKIGKLFDVWEVIKNLSKNLQDKINQTDYTENGFTRIKAKKDKFNIIVTDGDGDTQIIEDLDLSEPVVILNNISSKLQLLIEYS